MNFKCDNCGEVEYLLFDAYPVGDTLLEGVMFQVKKITETKYQVTPDGSALDYMKSSKLNIKQWCKKIANFMKNNDDTDEVGDCPKCGNLCNFYPQAESVEDEHQIKLVNAMSLLNFKSY